MIHIEGDYYIVANNVHGVALAKKETTKTGKNEGKTVMNSFAYYTSVKGAIAGFIFKKLTKFVSEDTTHSLKDLVNKIKELEEFIKINVKY